MPKSIINFTQFGYNGLIKGMIEHMVVYFASPVRLTHNYNKHRPITFAFFLSCCLIGFKLFCTERYMYTLYFDPTQVCYTCIYNIYMHPPTFSRTGSTKL